MADLHTVLQAHHQAVAAFLTAARVVPPTQWSQPRAPGKWSSGQVAEHLALAYEVNRGVLHGDAPPMTAPRWLRPLIRRFLLGPVLRGGRFIPGSKSPRVFQPGPAPAVPGQLLDRLAAAVTAFEADAAARNRLEEINFFEHLVRSPAFAHALPMLQPPVGRIIAKWEWGSSLTLDGELARLLVQGGAYHTFAGTAAQAKALGGRVCDALFGQRYTDVEIFRTWEAWCPWFKGIAWDGTWLGIDKRESRVWLLSVTDTD